jgi:hypothetical protein
MPPALCDLLDCYQNERLVNRYCTDQAGISNRQFSLGGEFFDCQCLGGNPAPCPICTGVSSPVSFANNGLGAFALATFSWFPPVCPSGINPCAAPPFSSFTNTYNLASKETSASGGNTKTYKDLRLQEWQTNVGTPDHACHMQISLRFVVSHIQPFTGSTSCSGNDGFVSSVRYGRIWNGIDNAATFLAKPLYLVGVRWSYSLCPFNNAPVSPGMSDWNCVTLTSYTPTDCGVGECPFCTPPNPTFAVTDYNVGRVFTNCHTSCASGMNPVIDSFQPWTNIPTTISLT